MFIILCIFGFINTETIKKSSLWFWFIGQLTIFQYYTPDVLRTFGVGCPNGSLWTIPIEFIFYLLLPILFFFKKRNIILFLCFVLSIFINICLYNSDSSGLIYKLLSVSVFPWLYIFLFGSLIYLNWTKLRFLFEGKAFYYFVSYLLYVSLISEPSYYITSIEVFMRIQHLPAIRIL